MHLVSFGGPPVQHHRYEYSCMQSYICNCMFVPDKGRGNRAIFMCCWLKYIHGCTIDGQYSCKAILAWKLEENNPKPCQKLRGGPQ